MKKIRLAVFFGFVLAVFFSSSLIEFDNSLDEIRSNVLRLHILANSDSAEDQELKLLVRDELLNLSDELLCGKTFDQAVEKAYDSLDVIEDTAERVIAENGFDYDVCCQIAPTVFDDRDYGDFTMPSGEYTALCVYIGKAKGHNWWCVMYPPLCVGTSQNAVEDYFDESQTDILKNHEKYEIKFKCVEIFGGIKQKLSKLLN